MYTYADGIRFGFHYLLKNYRNVFAFGQGLWSPWYVGNSMTNLDKEFGRDRVIDSPVSELACTGAAIGASLCGYKPIIIHPRMDFMLLAMDQIINQAAKWRLMVGGQSSPGVTIRGIINRGGEQGAQHSQSLHSLFAHIPGLRVVMPSTVQDARDLLIASVLCDDPVLYLDDRWLYEREDKITFNEANEISPLENQTACIRQIGSHITLVGSGYSAFQCERISDKLREVGISSDVIDLRVINPFDPNIVCESVKKTGRIIVLDGGWKNCGLAGEVIASVIEKVPISFFKMNPVRITLTDTPAPCSSELEKKYYSDTHALVKNIISMLEQNEKLNSKNDIEEFLI